MLEAVLDKAMEDYTPSNYNDEPMDSNNEDTSSPYINDMGDEEESEAMEPVTKPRSFRWDYILIINFITHNILSHFFL